MAEVVDLWDKLKRYFAFTPNEIKGLVIAILVTAFIISFNDWGKGSEVDISFGFFNFFNAILIVTLSFLVHISTQRIWSLGTGYRLEWRMWGFGLLLGLIFAFLTNGKFWLILPGGIIVYHLGGHRLGWFRYGINWWALGLIALMGTFATMLLAVIFKAISGIFVNALIQKMITFNIVYAMYSLLPIPPLDGSKTFYGSRMLYAFSTAGLIAAAVMLTLNISILIAVVSSLLIAIALWILYYVFFEWKAWYP
ncbi:hypothetical protein HYU50_01295 [Candidatus Woesearchaeota archaeon]|nr:hypothetical protein [Candidatus Woesearchaeota archaeon]